VSRDKSLRRSGLPLVLSHIQGHSDSAPEAPSGLEPASFPRHSHANNFFWHSHIVRRRSAQNHRWTPNHPNRIYLCCVCWWSSTTSTPWIEGSVLECQAQSLCVRRLAFFPFGQLELELPQVVAEGRSLHRCRLRPRQVMLPSPRAVLATLRRAPPAVASVAKLHMSLVSLGPTPRSHYRVQQQTIVDDLRLCQRNFVTNILFQSFILQHAWQILQAPRRAS